MEKVPQFLFNFYNKFFLVIGGLSSEALRKVHSNNATHDLDPVSMQAIPFVSTPSLHLLFSITIDAFSRIISSVHQLIPLTHQTIISSYLTRNNLNNISLVISFVTYVADVLSPCTRQKNTFCNLCKELVICSIGFKHY